MDILTINDRPGVHPDSWYAATATPPAAFARARGAMRADVCIVGGGYAGLSAALHLARQGFSVVLLEASRLGSGASGRNGGQVGMGQRLDQETLEQMLGVPKAQLLWNWAAEAVALVRALITEGDIDCGWTDGVIHAMHRARFEAETRQHVEHMHRHYGYEQIRFLDRDEIRAEIGSRDYHCGSLDMGSGHLHPLRYVFGLARLAQEAGAQLHECSRAIRIETGARPRVHTDHATIEADHLILALNGYHNNILPGLAEHVMPINNFIAVTEPLSPDCANQLIPNRYAVADSRFVINYFRLSQDNRMIFGGGESYGYRFPADLRAKVLGPMLQVFPQLRGTRIDHAWGGTLGITMSRLPFFERFGPATLSVGGFSGQGVALATLAGKMAAEAVAGQAGRFDVLSALPTPAFPGGPRLRTPLLVAAMTWYSLRDKL